MSIRRTPGSSIYGPQRESWIAMPRGYIDGLTMSVENSQDINIAAGVCRDSTNSVNMEITDLTKKIDATWAVGDDAGGLNATDYAAGTSGTEPATWYHVFVIRSSIGVVDAGFDKDVSATNLLADSGYTHYRRIGSVLTDSAGPPENITSFTQFGDEFIWASVVDEGATLIDTTARVIALTVPPDIAVRAVFNVVMDDNNANALANIYSTYGENSAPSITNGLANQAGGTSGGTSYDAQQFCLRTNTSSQVGYRSDTTPTAFEIGTVGWIDPRGKDA